MVEVPALCSVCTTGTGNDSYWRSECNQENGLMGTTLVASS